MKKVCLLALTMAAIRPACVFLPASIRRSATQSTPPVIKHQNIFGAANGFSPRNCTQGN